MATKKKNLSKNGHNVNKKHFSEKANTSQNSMKEVHESITNKITEMQSSELNWFDKIILFIANVTSKFYAIWKSLKISTRIMIIAGVIATIIFFNFVFFIKSNSELIYYSLMNYYNGEAYNEGIIFTFGYELLGIFFFGAISVGIGIYKSLKKTYNTFISPDVKMFKGMIDDAKNTKIKL